MWYKPRFKVGDPVYGLNRGAADDYQVSRALSIRKITVEVWEGQFVITYDMRGGGRHRYAEKDLYRSRKLAVLDAEERNTATSKPLETGDEVYVVVLNGWGFHVEGRFPIKRVIVERNDLSDDVHTYYIVAHKDGTRQEHHERCVFKSSDEAYDTAARRNGKGRSLGKDYGMGEARLERLAANSPTVCPHCDMVF